MPPKQQDKVLVACPRCGHQQAEPRTAISSNCRKCGEHLRVQEILRPIAKAAPPGPERKHITCFECGADLEVPVSAESTMCKRCSRYIDMKDYVINNAVSKNFKTKGSFVIEPKGYVFNTEAVVKEAVIKGRFLGKLFAEQSLTIYSTAEIKGSFSTARLVIPAANHFRWQEKLKVASADIAGELVADILATDRVVLRSTAKLFGDVAAANLVVEEGAVVVGRMRVGAKNA
jgi:cytoskeletal protein CcmA (bactofilin family)/DNA-directed RNA polymerase subunit RPC12/RpoP